MFIGHFGLGMGAKKYAPGVSLGMLFIAVQFLDLLWPILLLMNVEHVAIKTYNSPQPLDFIDYPISHSLVMALFWSFLFGGIYWLSGRNKKAALLLGVCVLSHWILDLVVHFPDLPLYPGNSPKLGFSLWNSRIGTALIEGTLFITGIIFYLQKTRSKNVKGTVLFWTLIVLLTATHIANIFGPPPQNVKAIGWAAQLQWIFVLLAFWTDYNRLSISEMKK